MSIFESYVHFTANIYVLLNAELCHCLLADTGGSFKLWSTVLFLDKNIFYMY